MVPPAGLTSLPVEMQEAVLAMLLVSWLLRCVFGVVCFACAAAGLVPPAGLTSLPYEMQEAVLALPAVSGCCAACGGCASGILAVMPPAGLTILPYEMQEAVPALLGVGGFLLHASLWLTHPGVLLRF
jgi:hypothetical protein